jgi:uncharacterized protein (TIGR00255 family)
VNEIFSAVYSMTGFATVQGSLHGQTAFTLTLKSVNHRSLDVSLRLPSQFDAIEIPIRNLLKQHLRRGHVDVTLQMERKTGGQLQLNRDLLATHVQAYREAAVLHSISAEPDLNTLLRLPGVMTADATVSKDDLAELEAEILAQLGPLLGQLNDVRAQEGAALAAELRASMARLDYYATEVAALRIGVRDSHVDRLRGRLAELMQDSSVSEERLLTEAGLLADRSDIEEEVVRLRTHVERFLAILSEGGELGKRLDFLLQELNREANTLLSKTGGATGSDGLRITDLGLAMKVEIERAREQVQNLE